MPSSILVWRDVLSSCTTHIASRGWKFLLPYGCVFVQCLPLAILDRPYQRDIERVGVLRLAVLCTVCFVLSPAVTGGQDGETYVADGATIVHGVNHRLDVLSSLTRIENIGLFAFYGKSHVMVITALGQNYKPSSAHMFVRVVETLEVSSTEHWKGMDGMLNANRVRLALVCEVRDPSCRLTTQEVQLQSGVVRYRCPAGLRRERKINVMFGV
mmetsp:Transcript_30515/g.48963  ORF Transcript_30515/g.48963 Transcript_30515/m.48963 type:complete len:213 (-) Transcript_30515:1682-2320(-)